MSAIPDDFHDLPALQQLARALYHNGSVRGAALFVGAGFSKNAVKVTPDTPDPPSWWELLDELVAQLYPGRAGNPPTDPLRIAEEYRSYFGQSALDGFIRTRFPDRAWLPGTLHHQMLNFPWSEILTTNWDTLLERTADGVTDYMFDVVRTEADLAHARSKRIVKLHGTLGDKDPLIFAAEDYRTYPVRHAAFVNLARQIFIENDLCLIGFSGTDPNFLEWAGWVRDNLGGNARRIYLVGCLGLSASARKYLLTHNIAPIDLADLVASLPPHERHAAASKIFFDALEAEQPKAPDDWDRHSVHSYPLRKDGPGFGTMARKDDDFAIAALDETVKFIRQDRQNYPGWLVCPKSIRRHDVYAGYEEYALLRAAVLDRYDPNKRAEILDEFLWRYTCSFQRLQKPLLNALEAVMELPRGQIDRAHRFKFAVALMRHARTSSDRASLEKWARSVEGDAAPDAPEWIDIRYQRCLLLRDELDLIGLAAEIASISSNEPIWKLRKAGLYAEVGEHVRATRLIKEAAAELEQSYRLNRNSIWIKSALAWATWLHRVSEMGHFGNRDHLPRAREFKELKIDPSVELEVLQDDANEIRRKQQDDDAEVIPLFEPGSYRRGGAPAVAAPDHQGFGVLYELDQLMEVVGIPLRLNHVQVGAAAALSIARITYNHSAEWYVLLQRAMHAHMDTPFIRYFGRIAIAQLPSDIAAKIQARLIAAISYWTAALKRAVGDDRRDDRSFAVDELRLALSALSHLTVRMSVAEATDAFHLGDKLTRDTEILHWWIREAAANLSKYALQAIPKARLSALALSVMEFPLSAELGGNLPNWPTLVRELRDAKPDRVVGDPRWDNRVRQLLDAARPGQASRPEAIERLAYLSMGGALTSAEVESFALILWEKLDDSAEQLPADANLLESTFAQLPAPNGIDARARVLARILGRPLPTARNDSGHGDTRISAERQNQLISLYNLAPLGLVIPADRASQLFDQLVAWVPDEGDDRDPLSRGFARQFNDSVRVSASDALTFAIAPAMARWDRDEVRLRRLLDFISRTRSWRAVATLPLFVETVPALVDCISLAIHRGLSSSDHYQVSGSASALVRWAKLVDDGILQGMPRMLVEQLLAMIETRQQESLHVLLNAVEGLVKYRMLTVDDMVRLVRALADIREDVKYTDIALDSRRAVSASLIRQECVRVANLLKSFIGDDGTLSAWLAEAAHDPLPEVRFAANDDIV